MHVSFPYYYYYYYYYYYRKADELQLQQLAPIKRINPAPLPRPGEDEGTFLRHKVSSKLLERERVQGDPMVGTLQGEQPPIKGMGNQQ